ncbi:glycosyltransferase family A protein [Microbacterium sp.]|uniref:glycosyltransferase family A protein n=1 Tax=Microbacterium sp. TaxID=51671 RepID=UPI0028110AF7|nr:glycosyltransferase family A protein [Microbacterium sp.]
MRALLKKALYRAAGVAVDRRVRSGPLTPTAVELAYLRREEELYGYLRANGSREGRDVLALAASHGRYRAADLLAALRSGAPRWALRARVKGFAREPYLRLATLLADQARNAAEAADAVLLLRTMADLLGPQAIRKEGRFRLVELLVAAGETHDLPGLLARMHIRREDIAQPHLFTANAVNPFAGDRPEDPAGADRWLDAINALFALDDLEPVELAPGDGAPFDRLRSRAARTAPYGPLVTVIVPTYDPGPRLATAVESLLAQSHQALQVLIMDDASPPAAAEALDRWTARDPRIEVVHLRENNGPYLARNIAVSAHSRGKYVTIHDDDDWSHPRKIELQVAHLEAESGSVANMSNSIRASDDLQFGRINGNPVWTQQGLNSLMVRRSVFDKIGYWDVLNRSADAEFNDRIRSFTQEGIPVVGRVPTTFYRVRWDSLSAGEFNRGYMDARRRWYYQAYVDWHQSERSAGGTPYIPADDRGSRPFAAPTDFLGSRSAGPDRSIAADIVFASDFRARGSRTEAVCDEVERALSGGQRVALLQLDSPALMPDARIHPRALSAARHENAEVVSLLDRVDSGIVVVLDATLLQFLPLERSAITTERLVLAEDTPQAGRDTLYHSERVISTCVTVFGRTPESGSGHHAASFTQETQ